MVFSLSGTRIPPEIVTTHCTDGVQKVRHPSYTRRTENTASSLGAGLPPGWTNRGAQKYCLRKE